MRYLFRKNKYYQNLSSVVEEVLESFFYPSILGKFYLTNLGNAVNIRLYYTKAHVVTKQRIRRLVKVLRGLYGKPVQLDLIQIDPRMDRSLLAKYISMNLLKYPFHRVMKKVVVRYPIAGLEVHLAGQLTTQRAPVRKTT